MSGFNIALDGMSRAQQSFGRAASNVAKMPLSADESSGGDTVDLSAEMIAMLASRSAFEASIKTAQTFDQMQQSLLNLLG